MGSNGIIHKYASIYIYGYCKLRGGCLIHSRLVYAYIYVQSKRLYKKIHIFEFTDRKKQSDLKNKLM